MEDRQRRIAAVDALRGIVMIIMALDHVRDFFHAAAMTQSPTNMATTTPAVFLTRWITHFCAPVFLFTAGMGAYLWMQRGRTRSELSRFLVTRGLWLIFVELVVMRFAFDFSLGGALPVLLITLWALGGSMILLAGLIYLPVQVLAASSVAVICLHNLFDGVQAQAFGSWSWVWNALHQPGVLRVGGAIVVVGYPLLPLVATMTAGFCAGHLYAASGDTRRRAFARLGAAMTLAFVILRAINIYGDPSRWASQKPAVMTALSFLNCTKYPASLDFLLMTLGPALIVLAWLDRIRLSDGNPLLVFGRVPLFYFVGHFYWAHVLLAICVWFRYGATAFVLRAPPSVGGSRDLFPADFGWSLAVVYVVWALVVLTMYPACRWFAGVKRRRRDWWLSYT
ncbi:MAG: heparan-alpha-glucosaminide N-acetyltransferase domain-containing protein [Bryobacteraceae bacterium]